MAKQTNKTDIYNKYLDEYNKLAKKADMRLRELERFSRYKEFEDIKNYAYKIAKHDIEKWTPPEGKDRSPRWQRNAPMDTRSLKAKIADIKKFLNMKTSTVTGTIQVYKNRAAALNKAAEDEGQQPNFTWQQLADFFEMGLWEKNKDKYGSATLLISIGVMKRNKKEVMNRIKKKTDDHLFLSNDDVINETINSLLEDQDKDIKKLMRKF